MTTIVLHPVSILFRLKRLFAGLLLLVLASLLLGMTPQPAAAQSAIPVGVGHHLPQQALPTLVPDGPGVSALVQPQTLRQCGAWQILIVFSDQQIPPSTLRSQLLMESGVAAVDYYYAQYGVPPLAYLQLYDEVVLISNSAWGNNSAMGTVIASYQDSGGIVVVSNHNWNTFGGWYLSGNYASGGYSPFNPGAATPGWAGLGASSSGHPLMQGVTSLSAYYHYALSIASGATWVASNTYSQPLVAYQTTNGHTGIGLNAYLGNNQGVYFDGQWAKVIVNALHWLAPCTRTLTLTGTGSGTVTAAGINCTITNGVTSGDCTETVPQGTGLNLAASATAGYTFTAWSGALGGSANPASITVDADKTVSANFSEVCYNLSTAVDPPGAGTVTASPPTCLSNPNQYQLGSTANLTATPSAGYIFSGWSGALQGSGNPITMTMTGNAGITADFLPLQSGPTITVNTLLDDSGDSACTVQHCTLREAIILANATGGTNTIHFSVAGTLALSASLPDLTDSSRTTIDAEMQALKLDGGGAYRLLAVAPGASLTLDHLTLAGGFAANGGAILNLGNLTIQNSLLVGNQADSGGAVYNQGQITILNSTFASNQAVVGGGFYQDGGLAAITHSTFSGNQSDANQGGALYNGGSTPVQLMNTLVANSLGTENCTGTLADGGGNLVWGDSSCPGVQADPRLAPLGDYGGPTQTLALLPGSAAIDVATNCSGPAEDQRGMDRSQSAHCDSGAFESQGFLLAVADVDPQEAVIHTAFARPLSVSVTAQNPLEPVDGGQVVFTPPDHGASAILSAGPALVSGAMAQVTASANALAGGPYLVTASASPTSSVTFNLTNTRADTTAGLANSGSMSTYGDPLTLVITVSPTPDGGTVTFMDGSSPISACSLLSLDADGKAKCVDNALSAGPHTLTAVYNGNSNYTGSSSNSVDQNVDLRALTASVTAADKVYDGTLTATITGGSLSGVVGGDAVTVTVGTAAFDTAAVDTGKTVTASGLSLSGAAAANYTLADNSATTTANITPRPLTVTAQDKTKVYGEALPALTASYSGFASGETSDVLSGSPGLAAGAAAQSPVGSYPITISQGSLSSPNYTFDFTDGTLTVFQAGIVVSLQPSAASIPVGCSVTLSLSVSVVSPGAGVPTGVVTFKDGDMVLGTAQLASASNRFVAVLTTSGLTVGDHTLSAVYAGDANFAGSETSTPLLVMDNNRVFLPLVTK